MVSFIDIYYKIKDHFPSHAEFIVDLIKGTKVNDRTDGLDKSGSFYSLIHRIHWANTTRYSFEMADDWGNVCDFLENFDS